MPSVSRARRSSVSTPMGASARTGSLTVNRGMEPVAAQRVLAAGHGGRWGPVPVEWLDALVMNPDRTPRNPNMMWWRERLWLIDHGVALGFQYAWENVNEDAPSRVFRTRQAHVLESRVDDMPAWDEMLAERL